jgi:hypothetical protein
VVDEYNGVKVADNYRWLEDGKSPDVIAWTEAPKMPMPMPSWTTCRYAIRFRQFLKKLDETSSPAFYALEMRGGTSVCHELRARQATGHAGHVAIAG